MGQTPSGVDDVDRRLFFALKWTGSGDSLKIRHRGAPSSGPPPNFSSHPPERG